MTNTHPHYLYSDIVNSIKADKAVIEAMAGLLDGTIAYATDTNEFGTYDANTDTWTWLGAGALLYVQDEGVLIGTPNTLNFVGNNIDVSISGTVARVFVTGTGNPTPVGFNAILPGIYAYATGSTSVPHNTTTVMDVGAVTQNNWNGWSASEPNKIRVNETGFYMIGGNMTWSTDPGVGRRIVSLFITGSSVVWKYPSQSLLDNPTYTFPEQTVSTLQYLYSGSYIQLEALQTSSGTISNFAAGTSLWASKLIVSGSVQGSVTNVTNTTNVTNNLPGFLVQDEGTPLGTGTVFNFVGNNVTASVSGSVIQVYVTGSSSQSSLDGWNTDGNSWTFLSADAPSYVVSINANVTGTIGVGMKTQLTHQSQTKNFFIHAVAVTGSTSYLNLYGGTDYTLNVTGAITNPKYSQAKSPFGFPTNPNKWSVTFTDTQQLTQSNPTQNTWYNLGNLSVSVPIGIWRFRWSVLLHGFDNSTAITIQGTVSTSNNSESNSKMTASATSNTGGATSVRAIITAFVTDVVELNAKTTHYFNARATTATPNNIYFSNDVVPLFFTAECAYL